MSRNQAFIYLKLSWRTKGAKLWFSRIKQKRQISQIRMVKKWIILWGGKEATSLKHTFACSAGSVENMSQFTNRFLNSKKKKKVFALTN